MLTTREVIKTFYNALIHKLKKYRGNWDQNDPTADDYIKNRPFYTYTDEEKDVELATIKDNFSEETGWDQPLNSYLIENIGSFTIVPNNKYIVIYDGIRYELTAYVEKSYYNIIVGNEALVGELGVDNGIPFAVGVYENESTEAYAVVQVAGTHTISILTNQERVKKIDKKYLPDDFNVNLDLAPVATSGSYNDLSDTPIVYEDVVRHGIFESLSIESRKKARSNIAAVGYDGNQGLSTTNKDNARANIAAVGYEAQTLTSAQKEQARTNIGAGTSNYNDLTNKPSAVLYTTQSLTDSQKKVARNNIGAGTSNFDGYYNSLNGKPQIDWSATEGNGYIANRPCYDDVIDEKVWNGGAVSSYHDASGLYYKQLTTYSSFSGLTQHADSSLCFAIGYPSYSDERIEFGYLSFYIHGSEQYASTLNCWGNPWLAVKYTGNSLYEDGTDARNQENPLTEEQLDNGLPFCFCNDLNGGSWIGVTQGFLALAKESIDAATIYTRTKTLQQLDPKYLPDGTPVVPVTTEDNGKVLGVVDGEYALVDAASEEIACQDPYKYLTTNAEGEKQWVDMLAYKNGINIEWDGNTAGLEGVEGELSYFTFYKMSDEIIDDETLRQMTIIMKKDGADTEMSVGAAMDEFAQGANSSEADSLGICISDDYVNIAFLAIVRKDNLTYRNVTFEHAGVYFMYAMDEMRTVALKSNDAKLKTVDPVFLPQDNESPYILRTPRLGVTTRKIEWDGNIEGRDYLTRNGWNYYKVSDEVPVFDNILYAHTQEFDGETGEPSDTSNALHEGENCYRLGRAIVVTVAGEGSCKDNKPGAGTSSVDRFTAPSTGIYLWKNDTYGDRDGILTIKEIENLVQEAIVLTGRKKKFYITVDDNGNLTATEVGELYE